MLLSTVILGWIGILIFLIIAITFNKLAKNNEFGFLHILMAVMYAMWLPLPIVITQLLNNDVLQVGMIFGIIYVSMMVITMTFQTGIKGQTFYPTDTILVKVNQEPTKSICTKLETNFYTNS